jgi:hypothetical protein
LLRKSGFNKTGTVQEEVLVARLSKREKLGTNKTSYIMLNKPEEETTLDSELEKQYDGYCY